MGHIDPVVDDQRFLFVIGYQEAKIAIVLEIREHDASGVGLGTRNWVLPGV